MDEETKTRALESASAKWRSGGAFQENCEAYAAVITEALERELEREKSRADVEMRNNATLTSQLAEARTKLERLEGERDQWRCAAQKALDDLVDVATISTPQHAPSPGDEEFPSSAKLDEEELERMSSWLHRMERKYAIEDDHVGENPPLQNALERLSQERASPGAVELTSVDDIEVRQVLELLDACGAYAGADAASLGARAATLIRSLLHQHARPAQFQVTREEWDAAMPKGSASLLLPLNAKLAERPPVEPKAEGVNWKREYERVEEWRVGAIKRAEKVEAECARLRESLAEAEKGQLEGNRACYANQTEAAKLTNECERLRAEVADARVGINANSDAFAAQQELLVKHTERMEAAEARLRELVEACSPAEDELGAIGRLYDGTASPSEQDDLSRYIKRIHVEAREQDQAQRQRLHGVVSGGVVRPMTDDGIDVIWRGGRGTLVQLHDGAADATQRRCKDCRHMVALVNWWCTSKPATNAHGTAIPWFAGCAFWEAPPLRAKKVRATAPRGWWRRLVAMLAGAR